MKTAIIIPTYNERDNIDKLINEIFSLEIEGLEVVVVDDNSPDGTGKIVAEISAREPRVRIIHRKKKMGLGTAYLEGFRFALENGAEHFFEIDADFSHDHKIIPIFLDNIKNADLVVGSRYIPGGKTVNWDWKRKLISHFGNVYARTILGIPIRDLTTGYKCYRREVVEYLSTKNIDSVGYVFQVETSYIAHKQGFKVKEIPIIFTERRNGRSKFDGKIIWESFWKVFKLRLRNK